MGVWLAVFWLISGAQAGPIEAGPWAHEFPLTLVEGRRIEAAGPLFSSERRAQWDQWALSPFLSYRRDRSRDQTEFDLLYPLLTVDRFGEEYKVRWFLMTSWTGGREQVGHEVRRFTLFPFFFSQRSPVPPENYTALFPLYGTLKHRLLRDETHFVMFPLYARTRKKDVVTDNYLYPLVHVRRGEGLRGWQFWPFLGNEVKAVTQRTNAFDEVATLGGHRKFFALWPLYFESDLGIGTTNPVTQRVLLPFYSLTRSPLRDSSTYLWPLFTYTEDREKGYWEWDSPYPLIVFARGPGKNTDRIWPFYSRARTPTSESRFYAWPLYKVNRIQSPPLARKRERICFYLYSNIAETNLSRGTTFRRKDLWPLYTTYRDHEGNARFQALAVLEPILPFNKAMERNYSPLWSLWRWERNPAERASSASLLWNFYRYERRSEARKYSLCFGLFQYQSTPAGRRVRLFYVPLTRSRPAQAGESPA